MKRMYEKPAAYEEAFMANEYVAACYYLACDVGPGKRGQTNYSNGPYWNGTEYGGVSHSAAKTPNTCADPKANRVITDSGQLLSGASVGEYNGEQGWITGGIDKWIDTNGDDKVNEGDVIYWHTFGYKYVNNKPTSEINRRWNHHGVLTLGPKPNHS